MLCVWIFGMIIIKLYSLTDTEKVSIFKQKKKHIVIHIFYKSLYEKDIYRKGEFDMLKALAKMAEKYAKSTNTACMMFWILHQPKMPASLIKKD